MEYYGKNGKYSLASQPMKQGGEGAIYAINGRSDLVAKIYFKERITTELAEKLAFMSNNPPDASILSQIAWPQDVLREQNGDFVGFVMPKLKIDSDLKEIYVYPPKKDLQITYEQKIIIAINICVVISAIHKAGYTFGDFNPLNIGVNLSTGHVAFLDTDSYHIYDKYNRKMYRCGVCLDGYVAPELIQQCKGTDYLSAPLPTFTQETDKFALAIHIFKLLMNGFTPFNGIKETDSVSQASPGRGNQAIEKDNYCFKAGNKPQSVATPDLSAFPPDIQYLFKRAFIDGRENPEYRPSADEWYKALLDYKKNLVQCKRDVNHFYYVNDRECPYCAAEDRYNASLGRPSSSSQMTFSQPISVPSTSTSNSGNYRPTSASSPRVSGSSNSSYVGASGYQTSSIHKKKGNFTKKLLGWVVTLGIVGALFGFVIWPKVIYPNMANDDFYTPEIVQSYCYSNEYYQLSDVIFTITECTEDGQVNATWEFLNNREYGRVNLTGKIIEKKNNGNVVIEWTNNSIEIMPEGITWADEQTAKISKKWTSVKTDTINLTAGINDEHTIKTAADFQKLSGSNDTFFIKNDIDLADINWVPIDGFSGTLIGNGFAIKNLTIDSSSSNVGMFSTLSGFVNNLNIEDANITVSGRNENIGILCGELSGRITNVSVSGNVIADKSTNVGGIVGYVSTVGNYTLDAITNNASVTGLSYVGGCFGKVYDYIPNGIHPYSIILSNIKNHGTVVAIEDYAAGIVAHIDAEASGFGGSAEITIVDCSNNGSVSGAYYVGGIVGWGTSDSNSTIDNCTNSAEISAKAYVGCIAGATGRNIIQNCSNEGSTLTASGHYLSKGKKYAYVGGIVGSGTCLENCTNYIDIMYNGGGDYVGGLMGYCTLGPAITGASWLSDTAEAHFKGLTNKGNISGNSYVGGIIGGTMYYWDNGCTAVAATFENLLNIGNVVATDEYVGGIAGYMAGGVGGYGGRLSWYFYDSTNEASITGKANVGGLFGGFRNGEVGGQTWVDNKVVIDGCSSTGKVSGNSNCNDIIGFDDIKR